MGEHLRKITGFEVIPVSKSGEITDVKIISPALVKFLDSIEVCEIMMTHIGETKFYSTCYLASKSNNTSCIINRYGKMSAKEHGGKVDIKQLVFHDSGANYMNKVIRSKTTSSHGYMIDYSATLGSENTAKEKMRLLIQACLIKVDGEISDDLGYILHHTFKYENEDKDKIDIILDGLTNGLKDEMSLDDLVENITGVDIESGLDMSDMLELPDIVEKSENESWGDW